MLPAFTISDVTDYCKMKYEYKEKRIVGIMLARYTIDDCRDMVKQHFDY